MLPANIALDPATQRFLSFLEQLKRPQVFEVPVEEARAMYVKGQDLFPVAKLPAQVEDRTIHAGPTGVVRMRVFKPKGAGTGLP
ncbi:MAG: lipase, partial [Candidatus Angelobacter sp.]